MNLTVPLVATAELSPETVAVRVVAVVAWVAGGVGVKAIDVATTLDVVGAEALEDAKIVSPE
jgi:hypothetical protein